MVKTLPFNAGGRFLSLVRELRSHMPHSQKHKTYNRNNIVTNSIKTLKMVHLKKKMKNVKNCQALLHARHHTRH